MEAGLRQRQSQTMTLAPQLRQGLKMLAMSLPELRSELIAEMAKNPVIDDVEPTLEKTTFSEKEHEGDAAEAVSDYPDEDFDARDTARPDAEALECRCRIALKIGEWKKAHGVAVLDAAREKALLDKIAAREKTLFPAGKLAEIYRIIFEVSRQLQEKQ